VIDETWERVRAGPAEEVAGVIDRELFADHCTRAMLPRARALCDRTRPDLVVRESCEYASAIVAAKAGIVHAQVGISQACIEWGCLGWCPRQSNGLAPESLGNRGRTVPLCVPSITGSLTVAR
jgi:hypothetical protein